MSRSCPRARGSPSALMSCSSCQCGPICAARFATRSATCVTGASAWPRTRPTAGCTRVVSEGTVRAGDPIRLEPPAGSAAEDFLIARRFPERAERSSTFAMWGVGRRRRRRGSRRRRGGHRDCVAPDVPGAIFNSGFGFALLPDLVHLAVEHLARHRTRDGCGPTVRSGMTPSRTRGPSTSPGRCRQGRGALGRRDQRARAAAHRDRRLGRGRVEAASMEPAVAAAWRALEPHLALDAHTHRFVAERDGAVVGTGLLHASRCRLAPGRSGAPGASRPRDPAAAARDADRPRPAARLRPGRRVCRRGERVRGQPRARGPPSRRAPRSLPGGGAHRLTHSPLPGAPAARSAAVRARAAAHGG